MSYRLPLAAALSATFALGACTDPAALDPNNPHQNRNQGALAGGVIGAGLGGLLGGGVRDVAAGAVVGTIAGAAIGSSIDRQAADLRQQLANDGITVTAQEDRLVVTVPNDITFATDSATVYPALRADLDRVAAHLVRFPDSRVQVIGHTDSTGDAAHNQRLSERRALAVAEVLQGGGVAPARIQTIGRGEDEPFASNLTPEGRAQNRRVEIVVIPRG